MEPLIWTITIALMLVGFLGVILPAIPGPILILAAAILHKIFIPSMLSWWTVALIAMGTVLCMVIDWICIAAGTKMAGATRWAFMGAGIGFLVGIAFTLPGMIIGPIIGAILAEWLIARRTLLQAGKAGLATGTSILVATIARAILALAMIAAFIVDCFWI